MEPFYHPVGVTTRAPARARIRPMSEGIMYMRRPMDAPPPARMSGGQIMEWTLLSFSLFWPRLFILGFWIFSKDLGEAFSSWIIPALGFVIAPWTTLAYAFMWAITSKSVDGWEWSVVALGVIVDLVTYLGVRGLTRR
jgi:hypothetical protein